MPVFVVLTRGDNTRLAKEHDIEHKRYKIAQGNTITEFVVSAPSAQSAHELVAKIVGKESVIMALPLDV